MGTNLKPMGIYGLDRAVATLEAAGYIVKLDQVRLGYVVTKIADTGGWRRDGVSALDLIELADKAAAQGVKQ